MTGVVPDTLPPAFLGWLSIVFRTWGGFVIGTSLWLLGYSLEFLTARERWLKVGAASGLLFAFGSFLFSNVQLRSDFLWFIGVLAALAAWVACLLLWPAKARPR